MISFLERRELGAINIGGAGKVVVDGDVFDIGPREAIYIGMGAKSVEFTSDSVETPARFLYELCTSSSYLPNTQNNAATSITRKKLVMQKTVTFVLFINSYTLQFCQHANYLWG